MTVRTENKFTLQHTQWESLYCKQRSPASVLMLRHTWRTVVHRILVSGLTRGRSIQRRCGWQIERVFHGNPVSRVSPAGVINPWTRNARCIVRTHSSFSSAFTAHPPFFFSFFWQLSLSRGSFFFSLTCHGWRIRGKEKDTLPPLIPRRDFSGARCNYRLIVCH